MYRHFIFLLALTALFSSCSNDEPEVSANEFPTQSEFKQKITGKTWVLSDEKYVDSDGHIFYYSGMTPGYFYNDGYLFSDSSVRCAYSPYHENKYSYNANWQYDEQDGRLYIFTSSMNPNNYEEIQEVTANRLVIHTNFGCLPNGHWEYTNGLNYTHLDGMDEGSYARLVYRPLASDEAPADFWARYPEQ